VKITKSNSYGLVNLALARDPTSVANFGTSSRRTDLVTNVPITANALILKRGFGWKVHGFQLNTVDLLINRPVPLVFGLAIATFFDCSRTTSRRNSLRRFVDCHWYRGNSYLRLGWEWIKGVLYRGWRLFRTLCLSERLTGTSAPLPNLRVLNASFRSELFLCFCSFVSQPGQEPVLSALE